MEYIETINKTVFLRSLFLLTISGISLLASSQNLISNPSFEQNNLPYCKGWYDGCGSEFFQQCDSMNFCGSIIIHESPPVPNSGEWCLEVFGSFPNSGKAETYITGQKGTYVYQLKFWLETEHFIGEAYLGHMRNRIFVDSNSLVAFGEPWKEYTLLDTITTNLTDTIGVRLTASIGDFCICDVEFDLIELTIIDSLATSVTYPNSYLSPTVFPNPFEDKFTIRVPGYSGFNVTIFDITGKEVVQMHSFGDVISVNMTEMSSGVYFYQLTSEDYKIIFAHGKVIKR